VWAVDSLTFQTEEWVRVSQSDYDLYICVSLVIHSHVYLLWMAYIHDSIVHSKESLTMG